jgi:murein DD-endopeptidase MepM/ murein hydrolase activator NlpD
MKENLFHWPVPRPTLLNQKFGENQACVDIATGSKTIFCNGLFPPDGFRSLYGAKGHLGIDIPAYHGQEIYCSREGLVDFIDTNPRTGLDVKVVTEIAGKRYRHIYEHLLGYQPKLGSQIQTGQLIGWADNTGYSAGDHLHFQLELEVNNVWVPIDPQLYLSDLYAKDVLAINFKLKYIAELIAKLADNWAAWLRNK